MEIRPSGHRFPVEHGETVLEAALRAGIALPYSCNNGSCGECKARVLAGRPGEELPHDFVLKGPERHQGVVLLCRTHADSDLVIEAPEAGDASDIPLQRITTTVYKLEQPADDVCIVHLRTPRSKTLRFLAGQHVRLRIDGVGAGDLSIASCPCNGMFLQFHVRRIPGDALAEHVFGGLQARAKVDIEGPYGRFTLDEGSRRPALFIARGTGFAAIKSLIEHAIALEFGQPMRLYWVVRGSGHYLLNHCRAWRDALDGFHFTPLTVNRATAVAELAARGLAQAGLGEAQQDLALAAARIVDELGDLGDWDVYASGPGSALAGAASHLIAHGLPPQRLFIDDVDAP